jgi:predicted double-glycine peptidase
MAAFVVVCGVGACSIIPVTSIHDPRLSMFGGVESRNLIETPFVKQTSDTNCGAAALATVSQYLGVAVSVEDIVDDVKPSPLNQGFSIRQLRDVAMSRGLHAFAVRLSYVQLADQIQKGRPVIVPLRIVTYSDLERMSGLIGRAIVDAIKEPTNHFVVVIGIQNERIYLMDPGYGVRRVDRDAFDAIWKPFDGAALIVVRN